MTQSLTMTFIWFDQPQSSGWFWVSIDIDKCLTHDKCLWYFWDLLVSQEYHRHYSWWYFCDNLKSNYSKSSFCWRKSYCSHVVNLQKGLDMLVFHCGNFEGLWQTWTMMYKKIWPKTKWAQKVKKNCENKRTTAIAFKQESKYGTVWYFSRQHSR